MYTFEQEADGESMWATSVAATIVSSGEKNRVQGSKEAGEEAMRLKEM